MSSPPAPTLSNRLPSTISHGDRGASPRRRIRLAFCIESLGTGGTELNAIRTAERLDRSRFDITAITLAKGGPMAARYEAAGIPVVSFPLPGLLSLAAARQARRFARFLAAQRFDVVHSHDKYNNVFAVLAGRAAGVPAIIASKRWWVPEGRHYQVANAVAFRFAHCVLANSDSVARSLRDVERVAAGRIAVVHNFVDDQAFAPIAPAERARLLREIGVPDDALVVGLIAGLRAVKDIPSLLEGAAQLRGRWPALHVVLVGDGSERDALARRASALGIDGSVHFAGHRGQEPNLHGLFDISVLCSLREGFPNSIVEAMAAARPVVATNVGGIPDAVAEGETGLLVPPQRPDRLAAALDTLLADAERRARMGAMAQQRARERYHVDAVLPKLEELYERLAAGRVR
jgi:glycosyltransferase involved in cell wall biosynthesis